MEEAFELLKRGNLNETELAEYDRAVDARRVDLDALETAEVRGIEKGKAEGKAEAKIELAKKMLADNAPINQVAAWTGLSVEELAKL
jgi:predicted transposase/invertase (TIGR01784 family)